MIEVFESRASYLQRCIEKERLAAESASTSEARDIHRKLALMYEREAARATTED